MNSLYGDNIFKSNDIIIDRLFESINNDILMYDGLLTEAEASSRIKDLWNKFVDKVQKIIQYILQKITEFKSNIQTKMVLERWKKAFTNHDFPFSVIMPSPEGYDGLMKDIQEYYKDIKNVFDDSLHYPDPERPISRVKLDNSEKIYDEYYDTDRKYFDILSDKLCWKVTFKDDSGYDKIFKKLESMIKEHFSNMNDLKNLISKINKDINEANKDISKITNHSSKNFTNTGLESYSFLMRELYTILRIAKDFVAVQEHIILKPRIVSDKDNK